jgi:hypothetical protein
MYAIETIKRLNAIACSSAQENCANEDKVQSPDSGGSKNLHQEEGKLHVTQENK